MERNNAYTFLSDWFEYLNDDCGYEKWSQYLVVKLKEVCMVGSGLDVGCGSGAFTRAFAAVGYDMTGLDVSEEMLTKARTVKGKNASKILYLQGDVCSFSSPKKYEFVTAINDLVNYIPKEKYTLCFQKVYNLLKRGGIFLFDISSKRKFERKLANTVSIDDREDVTYIAFNNLIGDRATIDVSLFVKRSDGLYERKDETHEQTVYTEEEIVSALTKVGFSNITVEGFMGEEKSESDRICFSARK